ncbi:MAG: hypothetical protein WC140_04570 [Bacteroidales bacterium]
MKTVKIFILFIICILVTLPLSARRRKSNYNINRKTEVVMIGVGTDGTKAFKIYVVGRHVKKAMEVAKKAAIEVCIFRGLPSAGSVGETPALCDSKTADANKEYFENFFDDNEGQYIRYINITTDGYPSGRDRIKVKGGYKCGIIVQVMYDNLREKLENDGIIKSLNSGF